jgi:hypothetical protein
MNKPIIQINDFVREMTDEEYANYQTMLTEISQLPQGTDETPSPD